MNALAYSAVELIGGGLAAGVCMATLNAPKVEADDKEKASA